MSAHKDVIRFTFDCPIDLHTIAKMKASALHQSMKNYLIGKGSPAEPASKKAVSESHALQTLRETLTFTSR